MNTVSTVIQGLFIVLVFCGTVSPVILAEDEEIRVVGIVEQSTDPVMIRITEIIQSTQAPTCDFMTIEGPLSDVTQGDILHVVGIFHPHTCVISVEGKNCSVRKIPADAVMNDFSQSLHCTGKIMRIFEMKGGTYYDISLIETLVVTYQQKEMCQMITIQVDPVIGYVEVGLQPGDTVEFFGTYDEKRCMGSLDWYEDYLRKERKTGISWVLVVGGCVGYLFLRNRSPFT
ncbi:MAG: hypothetical protein HXS53_02215 [Theionarchaea archaeon]|nr:hypothetical protein [Theionarchaea archaeon]